MYFNSPLNLVVWPWWPCPAARTGDSSEHRLQVFITAKVEVTWLRTWTSPRSGGSKSLRSRLQSKEGASWVVYWGGEGMVVENLSWPCVCVHHFRMSQSWEQMVAWAYIYGCPWSCLSFGLRRSDLGDREAVRVEIGSRLSKSWKARHRRGFLENEGMLQFSSA